MVGRGSTAPTGTVAVGTTTRTGGPISATSAKTVTPVLAYHGVAEVVDPVTAITRAAVLLLVATIATRCPTYDPKRVGRSTVTSKVVGHDRVRRSAGTRCPLRCPIRPDAAARRVPSLSGATGPTRPCLPGGPAPTAVVSSPSLGAGRLIVAGLKVHAGTARGFKGAGVRKGPKGATPGVTPRPRCVRAGPTKMASKASGKGAVVIGSTIAEETALDGPFYGAANGLTTTGT